MLDMTAWPTKKYGSYFTSAKTRELQLVDDLNDRADLKL